MTGNGSAHRKSTSFFCQLSSNLSAYIFVGPSLLLIGTFSCIAIAYSLWISLHNYDVLAKRCPFVGLENYRELLHDEVFLLSLLNTSYYALMAVPSILLGALILALLADRAGRGSPVIKVIYFIPSITPGVVVSLLWVWLLRDDGAVNQILATIGISGPNWLQNPHSAMPAIVVVSAWQSVGYYMIVFMAGLSDIPKMYYEAALIDGAGPLRRFLYITIPLLRNTLVFVMVMLIIGSYQVFTQVYIMTNGGPQNATEVVQAQIFRNAFQFVGRMGYAAAMAWVLFAIIAFFVVLQMRLVRSTKLYD
ncbi:MAG TPA: sugar ABC transporter permease [Candidatus Hydrogenedentes bacterium]|nr:sugar ABC transporter permease [Candidatus Hydrogenedentota bacterium]HOL75667.1 sugar ABC transporter permease [Candidatus Hydrogenedentota bacterium]